MPHGVGGRSACYCPWLRTKDWPGFLVRSWWPGRSFHLQRRPRGRFHIEERTLALAGRRGCNGHLPG
ncbi:hypothetical protein ACFPRL_36080 [Pseudoclavibacter helvolus]